ncbi:MFS transporter [Stratiformator vulcanicus]|uniref:Major Facilitator Superfamily protein n=1 Tax=Stratiformator vulcanicus TaxID=2527980 RepID=A0A517R006_9PLAN|nr:MFS transporter [Stratiformator vulcanicus]QDT37198.1 hypothetical protein Pan189_15700 [Stratiformator vulcanicus]
MSASAGAVFRAATWNQILWSAGYPLTAGGFLVYWTRQAGAGTIAIAILLALPETAGLAGGLSRRLQSAGLSRKLLFLACSVAGTLSLLPLLAIPWLQPTASISLTIVFVSVAISHAIGSVGYVAYLSWLSDLAPQRAWGRLFAWREAARIVAVLIVPASVGYLQRAGDAGFLPAEKNWFMASFFLSGIILQLASLLPLARLPSIPLNFELVREPQWQRLRSTLIDPHYRRLLTHNWLLSAANGLTQSAFFLFATGSQFAAISLGTYYVLGSWMRGLQLPVSFVAGRLCDLGWALRMRVIGVVVGSAGLLFWFPANDGDWRWLIAAFACWGMFAAANVSGSRIMLAAARRSDNSAEIALFRQVGGFLAGLFGLLGGVMLTALQDQVSGRSASFDPAAPFFVLFALSLVGRFASLLPLIGLSEQDVSFEASDEARPPT